MPTKVAVQNRKKKSTRHTRSQRPLTGADIRRVITSGREVYGSKKTPRVVRSPWANEVVVFVSSQKERRQLPNKVTVEGKQYSLNVQKKTARAAILAALRKLRGLGQTGASRDDASVKRMRASPFAEERRVVRRAQLKQKPTASQIHNREQFLGSLNAASI